MDAAMEQDEALKERVEFMKQGASYMQEESEPAAFKSLKCFIEFVWLEK